MENKIDFDSKVAYYLQLKEFIQQQIDSKLIGTGDMLPSEAEYCAMYEVSRTVVRQALMELEHEGAIIKRRGKGTFVTRPKINIALTQLKTGFSKKLDQHGQKNETKVMTKQLVEPSIKVREYMNLIRKEDMVIHVERLRFVNKEPMVLQNLFLNSPLCDPLLTADLSKSLYEKMQTLCGLEIAKGDRIIEAVAANEKESRLLNVYKGTPMIKVTTFSYLEDQTLLEYAVDIYRGDRATIETKVVNYKTYGKNAITNSDPLNFVLIATD